ncbi:MAG TPA: DUF1080 domain-containing protein [Rariglobus sp.]|jgi:hypothetical protein|nr:DUF1080 domain-containing protein [Rariglobus sp.]
MIRTSLRLSAALGFLFCARFLPAAETDSAWKSLLDDKLSAWEVWIGVPHVGVTGLPEDTPMSPDGHKGTPLGLNNDPKHVFSVITEEGEPVLHISGEIFGGLTSLDSFSNYHLRVQFKWGQLKWAPRLHDQRDNGILYHCTGPHGAFWNAWKRCLEFQVQEKDMGDLFLLSGTKADVAATLDGKRWFYDPAGQMTSFGAGTHNGNPSHFKGDFEKPNGEWNTLELYTLGRTSVHVVNGHVVMVVHNAANVTGSEHTETPLEGGQLQIQSEGAEAYYRRIEIQPITAFPEEIKKNAGL